MRKKSIGLVFVVVLLLALFVGVGIASADSPGCPNAAASDPGQGAVPPRGILEDGGHGPFDDQSAHSSGDGQKNNRRCDPVQPPPSP